MAGWTPSMMARLKELEEENQRLKKMYAEKRLKSEIRRRHTLGWLSLIPAYLLARPYTAQRPRICKDQHRVKRDF